MQSKLSKTAAVQAAQLMRAHSDMLIRVATRAKDWRASELAMTRASAALLRDVANILEISDVIEIRQSGAWFAVETALDYVLNGGRE